MALCPTDTARLEFSRLGAELNLGAASPEWIMVVLYAEARGIFGPTGESDRAELLARLGGVQATVTSIEERLAALPALQKKTGLLARLGAPSRELLAFAVALLVFAAITLFVDGASARVASIALYCLALALGVAAAATYGWLHGRRR